MSYQQIIIYLVVIGAFYLLLIRPQQQRAKQQTQMVSSLQPGVEIVTIGGIYGTIVAVGDTRIRVRVADGSELEIAKRAIGSVVPAEKTENIAAEPLVADSDDEAAEDKDAPNA
ncbi:MAG: preprotein translocase subunit YajC [Coriobacteriia bacterium]|nr:preprotein translocase subunit YajC [Coriobacteriia bacterium]